MGQLRLILMNMLFAVVACWMYFALTGVVQVTVQRYLSCTSERAFQAITDFDTMKMISPDVLSYEFPEENEQHDILPPKNNNAPPRIMMYQSMKFRERRRMGEHGELVTNLHVTELQSPNHVRMVADTHGTIWDTTFDIIRKTSSSSNSNNDEDGDGCELTIHMEATAYEIVPRLLNPFMQLFFRWGLNDYINNVKGWCEKSKNE